MIQGYDLLGRTRKKGEVVAPQTQEEEDADKKLIVGLMAELLPGGVMADAQRDELMALELRVLKIRARTAGVDPAALADGASKALALVTGIEKDEVFGRILDEMLQLAIKGGSLPIHQWSEQLAPVFQASADAIALKTDRIRTAAEIRTAATAGEVDSEMFESLSYADQARWKADEQMRVVVTYKEAAMDVARDESATQAKVLLADNARDLATQAAARISAKFELPAFVGDAIEDIIMSFVPDITQELDDGIDAWLSSTKLVTVHSADDSSQPLLADSESGGVAPPKPKRCCSSLLYAWMPFDTAAQQSPEERQDNRQSCKPSWWKCSTLLRLLAMNSALGTNYIAMVVLFVLMDKTSEYQLVCYILHFKMISVLWTGLLLSAVGVINYMICVDQTGAEETTALASCDDSLIAAYPLFWPVIALWIISNCLIWVAFSKVVSAHKRSRKLDVSPLAGEVDGSVASKERKIRLQRSEALLSRTRFWLRWDLTAFALSALIGAFVIWQGTVVEDLGSSVSDALEVDTSRLGVKGGWELRQVVFWCHVRRATTSVCHFPGLLLTADLVATNRRCCTRCSRCRFYFCACRCST